MLNHELVRAIQQDREREIERALRARTIREAAADAGSAGVSRPPVASRGWASPRSRYARDAGT